MSGDAQNNGTTGGPRRRGRPWRPGESGNPGGRPRSKGLRRLIRRKTKDGRLLIKPLLRIATGRRVTLGKKWVTPTLVDMMAAIRELLDRGYGKSITAAELAQLRDRVPLVDARTVSLALPMSDEERAAVQRVLAATRVPRALTTDAITDEDDKEAQDAND